MGDNVNQNNQPEQRQMDATHIQEAREIQQVQERLREAASPGHQGDTLSPKELMAQSTHWQQEFASLPMKDGKIDVAALNADKTGNGWKMVENMVNELNKPGGAIEQAQSCVARCSGDLTHAQQAMDVHTSANVPDTRISGH